MLTLLLGIKALPKKGSAVFWNNLKAQGATDILTAHGGCPVLVGSKWITNKWIYGHDQALKFPCNLTPPKEQFDQSSQQNLQLYQKFRNENY